MRELIALLESKLSALPLEVFVGLPENLILSFELFDDMIVLAAMLDCICGDLAFPKFDC